MTSLLSPYRHTHKYGISHCLEWVYYISSIDIFIHTYTIPDELNLNIDLSPQIYVESLLGSSSLPNINLAGDLLTRSATDEQYKQRKESTRGGVGVTTETTTRIGYEKSTELVLSAASEYFNSSADLMDSCMDLAR